jgi:hypothetical protein
VESEIDRQLAEWMPSVVGFSSLAVGADQLFAQRVLRLGGKLVVVIPHTHYEDAFHSGADRDAYQALLSEADYVETLSGAGSLEDAYLAAGQRIVASVDRIFAVWNGKPAQGKGGTADVVAYALSAGVPVIHINADLMSATVLAK